MDSFRKNSTSSNDSSFSRDSSNINTANNNNNNNNTNNNFRSAGRRRNRRIQRSYTDSAGLGENFFLAQLPGRDRSGSSTSESSYNSFLHDDDKSVSSSRSSSEARPSGLGVDSCEAPELSQSHRMLLQEIGAALTLS